jgi:electron transfer flavoprotein alpha subunit
MTILVIAEHDKSSIKAATLNAVAAAAVIATLTDSKIHILVAGYGAQAVAEGATRIAGVSLVLFSNAPQLADGLSENVANTVLTIARNYSHIVAPATSYGKNVMPRIAAHLDVAQISDITAVVSADIFERPIFAGSAIATVQSSDPIKV